jgi:hypothetical protein
MMLAMETGERLIATNRHGYYKIGQFAVALGYYWLICLSDRTILAPLFGYQGLNYRSASPWTQISVLGLILLCTALTPVRYRQPSDGVLYTLLPLVVIPVLAVASTDVLFTNIEAGTIVSVAGAYLVLAACSMIPRPHGSLPTRLTLRQPWTIAVLLSIASYGLMFATFGIQFKLLSFSDVDGARAVFSEQASGPLNYLLDWQVNVINPFFIVYGIQYRNRLPLIAGVIGDFLIYTTTGYKSILFSALAVIGIIFALHQKKSPTQEAPAGVRLGFAFAALVAISYSVDRINNSITWTSLFVRRMSLVAGVNTSYYFQYFSVEPKTHLAYGVIGAILGEASAVPPPQQISIAAYHTIIGDPNANMWADAYANFGYIGVVIFTLILAGFLWLYDRAAQNVEKRAAAVLIAVPGLTLANSALFTCLLTHGMLLALLVITQWPRIQQQAKHAQRFQTSQGRSGSLELTV